MNQGKVHWRSTAAVQAEKEWKKMAVQEKEQKKKNSIAQAAALEQKALEKSKGQKNQLGISSNVILHVKRLHLKSMPLSWPWRNPWCVFNFDLYAQYL